jgi:hypothetical protein
LIDFHGWFCGYNPTGTDSTHADGNSVQIGEYFATSFASIKPSGVSYYGVNEGGIRYTTTFGKQGVLTNEYLAGWAFKTYGIKSTLIELPAPTFDGNDTLEIHDFIVNGQPYIDPYTNHVQKVIDSSAETFLTNGLTGGLNSLFAGYIF